MITHKGVTWPRQLPGGYLRPYVADLMAGREEVARLQAEGLDLDLDRLSDLDLAVFGASLPPTTAPDHDQAMVEDQVPPPTLAQLVDRIATEREPSHPSTRDPGPVPVQVQTPHGEMDKGRETAPERRTTDTPKIGRSGQTDSTGAGQADHATRAAPGTDPDKLPIRDTEDEHWRPT